LNKLENNLPTIVMEFLFIYWCVLSLSGWRILTPFRSIFTNKCNPMNI
jgi:hypothetical protein